ncbi:uncharacterized protein KY384_001017 [Bacidia gigantensis]|uniref:uncharacterized protein n=1 Tax=Bacidia gigantensis TaxID=2732470 RepID=UPI001D04BC81|nr:uncharacterized protein KY384_001017 [Bacidia gigantensis]KAG8534173.1 hypothetical protein KY384_001017 [Bacidia gigantensis]
MPHSRSASILSRIWKTPSSDQEKRDNSRHASGAHERFLENEGLLPPAQTLINCESSQSLQAKPARKIPRGDSYIPHHSKKGAIGNPTQSHQTTPDQLPRTSSALSRATTISEDFVSDILAQHNESSLSINQHIASPDDRKPEWLSVSAHPDQAREENLEEAIRPSTSSRLIQRLKSNSLKNRSARARPQMSLPSLKPQQTAGSGWSYPAGHLPAPVPTFGEIPGAGYEQPRPHVDLSSGAAARAAAAAQNEILKKMQRMELHGSNSSLGKRIGESSQSRQESLDLTIYFNRRDPLQILPQEIVTQTFGYLDATSVMSAELVSQAWNTVASSPHTWKLVFQTEFHHDPSRATSVSSKPDARNVPSQRDWKAMWRVRRELSRRWEDGQAAAIYLEGHTDSVYCVQFDRDKIITGSRDRTIRIWSTRTYKCVKVLGWPSCVKWEETFRSNLSASGAAPNLLEAPSLFHTGSVLCLHFDEDLMITGSSDTTLIVWELRPNYEYTPIRRLVQHSSGVLDVAFDKTHVVSCSKDQSICVWDRQTGSCIRRLTGHRGPVNAVQLRGNVAVSVGGDGLAKLWNLQSGICVKEFSNSKRGLACVELSLNAQTIISGGNDKMVYVFDTDTDTTNNPIKELTGHGNLVRSVHLDPGSGHIVTGSYDNSVKVWELETGKEVVSFIKWTSSWILSTKADYRRIVAASQDSRAVIMDFGYDLPNIDLLE